VNARRAWVAAASLACAALAGAMPAAAAAPAPAPLAYPLLGEGGAPALMLAQRTITREWGTAEDTLYQVVEIPAWRGEMAALGMSAVFPGAGQAYAGDAGGIWFALAEAGGWLARLLWLDRGNDLRAEAERYAGAPQDPGSTWSFDRWSLATGQDPSELQALYAVDREAYYDLIGDDPRYLAGWSGDAPTTRHAFRALRDHSDARLRNARYAGIGLWLNHVTAAAHALRAARLHNLPLRRDLDLKLEGAWRSGGPTVFAMIERRF
jgi:hypothetical protein